MLLLLLCSFEHATEASSPALVDGQQMRPSKWAWQVALYNKLVCELKLAERKPCKLSAIESSLRRLHASHWPARAESNSTRADQFSDILFVFVLFFVLELELGKCINSSFSTLSSSIGAQLTTHLATINNNNNINANKQAHDDDDDEKPTGARKQRKQTSCLLLVLFARRMPLFGVCLDIKCCKLKLK